MAQRAISHIQDPATEDHNKKTEYSNLSVLCSINHNQGFLLPQLFWGCSPALTHSLQAPLLMPPLNHSRRHPGNACGRKALKNHATSHAAWYFSSGMNLASSPTKISEYLSHPVIILSLSLLTSCWRHYSLAFMSLITGDRDSRKINYWCALSLWLDQLKVDALGFKFRHDPQPTTLSATASSVPLKVKLIELVSNNINNVQLQSWCQLTWALVFSCCKVKQRHERFANS